MPIMKTLRGKFRTLMRALPTVESENTRASRISEYIKEAYQFKDDVVKEKDSVEEDKKVKRDEAKAKDK